MIPLKNTEKGKKKDLGALYGKALDRHAQLEKELTRVMNRWQKSRAVLKRVEKKMDEAQAVMWDANAAYLDDSI
jgi:predicted  nucleic acid-binding Zn-ribbon protein